MRRYFYEKIKWEIDSGKIADLDPSVYDIPGYEDMELMEVKKYSILRSDARERQITACRENKYHGERLASALSKNATSANMVVILRDFMKSDKVSNEEKEVLNFYLGDLKKGEIKWESILKSIEKVKNAIATKQAIVRTNHQECMRLYPNEF